MCTTFPPPPCPLPVLPCSELWTDALSLPEERVNGWKVVIVEEVTDTSRKEMN